MISLVVKCKNLEWHYMRPARTSNDATCDLVRTLNDAACDLLNLEPEASQVALHAATLHVTC